MVNYLFANEHGHPLPNDPSGVSAPWQVRRAVDHMERNWDRSITIEELASITGASARSLFQLFRKTYDISPLAYLGQVRLRRARELLTNPVHGTSVTNVVFMCGFSNMGSFATKYHSAFGEKPSETLRKHRPSGASSIIGARRTP